MNKILSVYKLYKDEHEKPVEALEKLVSNKPAQLYFTDFKVQSAPKQVEKKDSKPKKTNNPQPATPAAPSKWISLKMVSNNPLVFQDYLITLTKESYFNGVTITQISSDNNGVKTANFTIGKGDVQN